MKPFLRILKTQIFVFGYMLFFAVLMLIFVVALQDLNYGHYTKHAFIIGISLFTSIALLLSLKYIGGEKINFKMNIFIGLIIFLISLPITWFIVSLQSVDPNTNKIMNIEMIKNAPLR